MEQIIWKTAYIHQTQSVPAHFRTRHSCHGKKAGRVEYRADRYGICHVPMGKVSFDTEKLAENYGALLTELLRVKPSTAKGRYVKSVVFSSSMGPGVKVDSTIVRNFTA